MWWYVAKRLLQAIPVFLGATLIIFFLTKLRPGDPILGLIGNKPVSPEVREALRDQFHLNDFIGLQWLYFLKDVVTFNPDFVGLDGQPVFQKIGNALPVTGTLALLALAMDAVIGIVVGTIAGLRRNGWFDSVTLVISLILLSIPIFVVGFVLQFLFGVKWGIFAATVPVDWNVTDLLLPAFVLAIANIATTTRLTRTSVANNMSADHVRTARAKGLSGGVVIRNHVLRNSLVPVVTYIGINLGSLMAGAIITEGIFNVQGIGNLAFGAVSRGDTPLTVSVVSVMVMLYVFMSLIVDLLYAVLDPRIRYV
ncbi:ABC transporter permease [Aeromicrobium sp. 9AM]|uniref:ABC transporter permease n=1 Tax=Aeromicrobium sp. 9AM TaxID=2653126 RepID=UPI0012F446B0|nr:ABC transporter permease [Aeromicrobium sp. 9AM]VXB22399.1 ABC transporter permease [Aeromicrobium sp. 9AM]